MPKYAFELRNSTPTIRRVIEGIPNEKIAAMATAKCVGISDVSVVLVRRNHSQPNNQPINQPNNGATNDRI